MNWIFGLTLPALVTIAELPAGTTPTGSEPFETIQSGVSVYVTYSQLATGIPSGTITNAQLATAAALTVKGNATNATATEQDIAGVANQVLRVNSGGTAWAFGQLNLASSAAVTGTLAIVNGGTGLTAGTSGGILGYTAAGTLASSVALTASAIVLGGGAGATPTPMGSLGTTTTVLHGNAAGAPTFGAVSLSADVTGTLPTTAGGTGLVTYAQGDLVYGSASNVLSALAKDANATRYLSNTGTTNNPAWAQVALTTGVSGVLPVANGGTGVATIADAQAAFHDGFLSYKTSVNFNVGNTDTTLAVPLPAGFTRWLINSIVLSGASGTLTTATVGVFTAAAGGGTAIVTAASAITVSTASEGTNNNTQSFSLNGTSSISYTVANVFIRVATAQGSAATGTVTVTIRPLS